MTNDWLARLKGHGNLVQRLVKEIPKALETPNLTLDQASRLHAIIQKGTKDLDEVIELMDGVDMDDSYRRAAASLSKIWRHLSEAAAERVSGLQHSSRDNAGSDDDLSRH
jgi:hypothetical protein